MLVRRQGDPKKKPTIKKGHSSRGATPPHTNQKAAGKWRSLVFNHKWGPHLCRAAANNRSHSAEQQQQWSALVSRGCLTLDVFCAKILDLSLALKIAHMRIDHTEPALFARKLFPSSGYQIAPERQGSCWSMSCGQDGIRQLVSRADKAPTEKKWNIVE